MSKNFSLIIFTDLDGSLLHRDNFKFDEIKNYLKNLIDDGIIIIPNTSKTEKETKDFFKELGTELPYIYENGSVINGLNLLKKDLPKELILGREKNELFKIFEKKVPENLKNKCKFLDKMDKKMQLRIFGLPKNKLNFALERKYSIPFIFEGNKKEKIGLIKNLKKYGLTLQEGGRVINLCDKISKAKSMQIFIKFFKKKDENVKTIAVGDNYNDLEMLKEADIPCLIFNDQFKQDEINIDNLLISNNPSPQGWADVIKMALDKLKYYD